MRGPFPRLGSSPTLACPSSSCLFVRQATLERGSAHAQDERIKCLKTGLHWADDGVRASILELGAGRWANQQQYLSER